MSEQQSAELRAALLGGLVERREGPLVCCIHTCVVLDQQRRNVHMLQGREPGSRLLPRQQTLSTKLTLSKFINTVSITLHTSIHT